MRLLHRLTAALSALLILQLTLLGSGTSCTMRGTGAAAKAQDMGAMAGMSRSGAVAAAPVESLRGLDRTDVPPTGCQSDEGCRMPWAPGQCASMTACIMTAIPSATIVTALDAPAGASALPMPGDLGSRPASPPELPPPRA